MDFRREYLVRLPLPLAQLYSRAFNAKDARARHDNAFYLCEALTKLAAAPAIACYAHEIRTGQQPHVPKLDRLLQDLALPSFGQWVGILRELSRHFGERADAASHPLGHLAKQLEQNRTDQPALLNLYRRIKGGVDNPPAKDTTCSPLDVLDCLVQYRNLVFGHGGPRFDSFFEKDMGPLLFPAVNELLEEGFWDFLGPRGSRLVYLTELRTLDAEHVEVGLRELIGLEGERLAPLVLSRSQAESMLPNRVAMLWPGRSVPLPLDPLLAYRESETAVEMLFLNRGNARQVEYLSYTTGRTERDPNMAVELRQLLSLFVGQQLTEEGLRRLADQSISGTPRVESPAAESTPGLVGRMRGDYEILAEIGRGGMGVVYLARQTSLGRLVALKMLPAELGHDAVALARFRREIQHLAHCEHPNIVKVLSSGTMPEGELYYTMEYVPGCDLEQVWQELGGGQEAGFSTSHLGQSTWAQAVLSASKKRREKTTEQRKRTASDSSEAEKIPPLPLPPLPELPKGSDDPAGYTRRVCELIRDAALALQAVHDQKLIHRDIKPANLMLTPDGARIVLMDFGLAKGESLALTASRQAGFLGTLRYAAPEQLAARTIKVGPAADVRGLGCVLWEMLTGRRLFGECQDEAALAASVLNQDVPHLRAVDPSFEHDLEAIVSRATERDVRFRINSAGLLAQYLQLYLDGKPLPIRPPTGRELFARWRRQNSLAASLLATIAIVLLISSIGGATLALVASQNARRADQNADRADDETQKARLAQAAAERARIDADKNARQAKTEADHANWLLYSREIADAQHEWEVGDAAGAWRHLDSSQPNRRGWEYNYLYTLFNQGQQTLRGHAFQVLSVAFSPDGKRIASGGGDPILKVWDATSGQETLTVKGEHTVQVTSLAFSPDSKRIASGSSDGAVRVRDATSGQETLTLKGHTYGISSVAFSPDGKWIVSGSGDKTLKVWDATTGQETLALKGHTAPLTSVAFSPDGKRIVSGSGDKTLKVWDATSGQDTLTLKGHTYGISSVAFSPDGKWIVSGSGDKTLKVWDATTGQETLALKGHTAPLTSVAFSPDGKRIVSGSGDETLKVWDVSSGKETLTLKGHTASVTSVAFSPDGKRAVSGSQDNTLKVWDAASSQETLTLKGHTAIVMNVAFSPDGKRIASVSAERIRRPGDHTTVKVWEVSSGQETLSLIGNHASLAFSPDGKRIVSGLKVWDATSGKEMLTPKVHPVGNAEFSPDGKWIVSRSGDQTLKVWDAASGRETLNFKGHTNAVAIVVFSPDGKHIASVSYNGTVKVWEVSSGRETLTLRAAHTALVTSLDFSPDGKRIASGMPDGAVKVWDATGGEETLTLKGHIASVTSVAFSPDGKRIASGSWDNTVKVWDATSGQETLTLKGHTAPLTSVAFSPDGKRIASGSWDKTVKVWDADQEPSTGTPLAVKCNEEAWHLATNPDAKLRDPRRAVELAKKAVELAPLEGAIWNTLGVASYRAGDWKAAKSALHKSMNLQSGGYSGDWFFLAMVEWRRGEKDRARGWYRAAALWMDEHGSQDEELRRFRSEAAALLGISERIAAESTDDPDLAAALADARLDSSWSYFWRGSTFAGLGQWDCAAEDFTKAIALGPPDLRFWRSLALARLAKDEKLGFQAACADMLKQFAETRDPETAYFVAWTGALAPDALADLAPAIKLAEHAVHMNPHWTQYAQGLGAILYRAGWFDEAVHKLEEVDGLEKQGGSNFSRACTGFFLAMADKRLRHAAEARKRFDTARDQTVKALGNGAPRLDWADRLTLTLLHREAEALVGKQAMPAPQSADKLTKVKK